MIKLIKLEWKKNNIAKYMRGAVILAAFLCLFVFALAFLGIANDPDGTLDAAEGMGTTSAPSFPIKRQKILASQMIAVWLFNFVALVVTKLLIYACVSIGSLSMESSFAVDFNMGSLSFYIQLLLKSFVIVSMGFIALFIGMIMKSSKATIIASFIMIFLTQANIGDFSLAGNLIFPAILTVVSFTFAVLSVFNAETRDLL